MNLNTKARKMFSKFLVLMAALATLWLLPASAGAQPEHFSHMFPNLKEFAYSDQAAEDLATKMLNTAPDPPGINNGTADDSKGLAAWLTYFGQFLDHNLDFDSTPQPTGPVNIHKLRNESSGRFDLHNLFGNGPSGSPNLYVGDHLRVDCTLGTPFTNGFPNVITGNANGACDLARNPDGTAVIFDPRDDENQIISQMAVAWELFYNHFVDQGMSYSQARALTVGYYQLQIFDQQLPDFVTDSSILALYEKQLGSSRTYQITTPDVNGPRMPVEFSVGAYRFGHSLVRNSYHMNDINPDTTPLANNVLIFNVPSFQFGDLAGGAPLQGTVQNALNNCMDANQSAELCEQATDHQIQWKYFFKSLNKNGLDNGRTNQARQTAPTISPALFDLPAQAIPGCADLATPVCNGSGSLVARDLARGRWDGLPSGQDMAARLGCPVISAASLNPTADAVFNGGTPLIYYVLAEAKQAKAVLGCTGSKIVAQVFLHALAPQGSFTEITPDPALEPFSGNNGQFVFQDLLIDDKLTPKSS